MHLAHPAPLDEGASVVAANVAAGDDRQPTGGALGHGAQRVGPLDRRLRAAGGEHARDAERGERVDRLEPVRHLVDRAMEGDRQLTGGLDRINKKTYIYANVPAPTAFTQFYEKAKNKPGWTVHTLPCTHLVQIDMPNELTALLLKAAA